MRSRRPSGDTWTNSDPIGFSFLILEASGDLGWLNDEGQLSHRQLHQARHGGALLMTSVTTPARSLLLVLAHPNGRRFWRSMSRIELFAPLGLLANWAGAID